MDRRSREIGRRVAYWRSRRKLTRQANYLLDVAQAHYQCARFDGATRALLGADQVAPEEVRCRPSAHQLIRHLLDTGKGQPSQELRQLAAFVGLPT